MKGKADVNGPEKLTNKQYLAELRKLQAELCALQEWVKQQGLRVSSSSRAATRPARAA